MFFVYILWISAGYLAGSLPTAYLVAKKFRNVDIRSFGSGNVGATNLGRLMGKRWAVFASVVDMLKGGVPVTVVNLVGYDDSLVSLVAIAAVLGHNYPVWLNFKGGKGVATTYGTMFFVCPWVSFVAVPCAGMVWYMTLKISGYVSFASILSLFSLSVFLLTFGSSLALGGAAFFLAVLSSWRHRSNLFRIVTGQEEKIKGAR